MEKLYLVLSENKLQIRKLTLQGAKIAKEKLEKKGYRKISIAYDTGNVYAER